MILKGDNGKPLPADASHLLILAAYQRQVAKTEGRTLGWLFDQYFKSRQFLGLSEATQRNYRIHGKTITEKQGKSGKLFGSAGLSSIDPPTVARYRDARADHPVAANRELQLLSAVFSWAVEQGHAKTNPCKGVRKFPGQKRTRYIEQWEFDVVQKMAPDYVAVAMELAYLMRARRSEVLAIRREDVSERGVYLRRGKGSEDETTLWTPALREAVQAAKAVNRSVISPWLLHDANGKQIKAAAFDTAWQRLMGKAQDAGLKERFTFHDIKAAGMTDSSHQWAGHRSERMKEVYIRKAREVDATR